MTDTILQPDFSVEIQRGSRTHIRLIPQSGYVIHQAVHDDEMGRIDVVLELREESKEIQ